MQQAINIFIEETSERLDLYPDESMEVNMGGISLLNLADRTATYTNSFKLPRTPINDKVFGFYSRAASTTIPTDIPVIIKAGLYQQSSILRGVEYDKDYKVKSSSSGLFDLMKNITVDSLFPWGYQYTNQFDTYEELLDYVFDNPFYYPLYTKQTGELNLNNATVFVSIKDVIDKVCSHYGYTAEIDSYFNFENDYYYKRFKMQFSRTNIYDLSDVIIGEYWKTIVYDFYNTDENLKVSDVLKAICQTYLAYIVIDENQKKIKFNSVYSKIQNSNPIQIETLSEPKKTQETGYQNINRINYELDSTIEKNFGGGFFTDATKNGEKEILKISAYVPAAFMIGGRKIYDVLTAPAQKLIIATKSSDTLLRTYRLDYNNEINGEPGNYETESLYFTQDVYDMAIVDLSSVYNPILNPIFSNPVILNTDGYIDRLTADNIMNDRVILSVKLGGRYWVDDMKYNLTTGKAVLKLIKL